MFVSGQHLSRRFCILSHAVRIRCGPACVHTLCVPRAPSCVTQKFDHLPTPCPAAAAEPPGACVCLSLCFCLSLPLSLARSLARSPSLFVCFSLSLFLSFSLSLFPSFSHSLALAHFLFLSYTAGMCCCRRHRVAGGTQDTEEEERCGTEDPILIHARKHPDDEVLLCLCSCTLARRGDVVFAALEYSGFRVSGLGVRNCGLLPARGKEKESLRVCAVREGGRKIVCEFAL